MNPDASINIKLVAWKEHPSKLTDEFDSLKDIFDILLGLEVIEVKPSITHTE